MLKDHNIAIIQNRIIKGGRFQVIAGLVKMLNEEGIVPDIVTLKSRINKDEADNYYGDKLAFNLREVFVNPRIPYDFNILFFNFIVRFYLKKYSLVINSSNSSFLLPGWANIISYVHYPRKDRLHSKKVSIHFPDGEDKQWFKLSHIFDNSAALLYRFNKKLQRNEKATANSEFTRNAILRNYKLEEKDVRVIYPPVWRGVKIDLLKQKKNYRMVCSTGRFAEDKQQLEQIKIAEQLPEYQFHIMGFAKESDPYFVKCKDYISDRKISNVFLHPNVEYDKMHDVFEEAGFFIHSLRNEPFGIVSVQAIESGCIPIVHNSGGQKEIVGIDALRYNNSDEAVNIFKKFEAYGEDSYTEIIEKLALNAQNCSYSEFCNQFKQLLFPEISNQEPV